MPIYKVKCGNEPAKAGKALAPSGGLEFGESIKVNDATGKHEAHVKFTEREATVELPINGIQLLFRELAFSDNLMVVSGIRFNNVWYGDAPDGQTFVNPFDDNTEAPVEAPVEVPIHSA